MKHEKIFKREDGTRYKISVQLTLSNYLQEFKYEVTCVEKCEKDRRKFKNLVRNDHRVFFKPSEKDMEVYLQHVTQVEIDVTMLELWVKIRPNTIVGTEKYPNPYK